MYLGHNVSVLRDLWEAIRTVVFDAVYGYAYDEESLDRTARRLFHSSFAPDAADAIATLAQGDGYWLEGKDVYKIFLKEVTVADLPFLDCVPGTYREDLLEYWSSVGSLRPRQFNHNATSSLVHTTTNALLPFSTLLPTMTSSTTSSLSPTVSAALPPATTGASNSSSLSKGAKIGIGLVIPLTLILAAVIFFGFWLRERRRRRLSQNNGGPALRRRHAGQATARPVISSQQLDVILEVPDTELEAGPLPIAYPSHPAYRASQGELHDTSRIEMDTISAPPHPAARELSAGSPPPTRRPRAPPPPIPKNGGINPLSVNPVQQTPPHPANPAELEGSPEPQVRGDGRGGLSERDQQIRELEQQEQAVARQLSQMSEVQRLEEEQGAIQRQLASLRRS